ncbi:hypothetical protein BsWGS_24627 [Bradybaena similaris]
MCHLAQVSFESCRTTYFGNILSVCKILHWDSKSIKVPLQEIYGIKTPLFWTPVADCQSLFLPRRETYAFLLLFLFLSYNLSFSWLADKYVWLECASNSSQVLRKNRVGNMAPTGTMLGTPDLDMP